MPIENKTADNSTEANTVVAPAVSLPATGIDPAQPGQVAAPAETALVSPLVTINGETTNLVGTAATAPEGLVPNSNVPQIPVDGASLDGTLGAVAPAQVNPVTGDVADAGTPAVPTQPATPVVEGATPQVAQEAAPATTVEGASPTATEAAQPAAKPAKAPLTLAERIDAKRKQLEKLQKEIDSLEARERAGDNLSEVKAGSVIVARVGRAETSREVTASVVGVQVLDNGDSRYKIYFGDGIDAQLVVIQSSQILDVKQV